MNLRRKEYLLQKIRAWKRKCRRESGQVEWCAGLFFLLFLSVTLCCQLQVQVYCASAHYMEDALAASNLASAVVDLEEYGKTQTVLLKEPEEAYERFCTAIKGNLQLNDAWECENKQLISGTVCVDKYIVYNVKNDLVAVSEVTPNGQVFQWQGNLGSIAAPNGVPVESTGIYSEITYPVKSFGGVVTEAHKGKLVDIVKKGE